MRNLALVALGATALAAPTMVSAQRVPGAVVAVVDTSRVYAECTACRSAQTALQGQVTTLQNRQRTLTQRPEATLYAAAGWPCKAASAYARAISHTSVKSRSAARLPTRMSGS